MFDKTILDDVIKYYKRDFEEFNWEREEFKWKAVKIFQDNWDINAEDFYFMLKLSLSGAKNLLDVGIPCPLKMILLFANESPESVRNMFKALYDENRDVVERIEEFKNNSAAMIKNSKTLKGQDFQTERAISIYLWLRYPNKYYIYKFREVDATATNLNSDYIFEEGNYESNLKNFYNLYDEICDYIKTDNELINLLQSHLTETHYKDTEFKTLTVDIGFYISRYYTEKKIWFAWDYSPNLTVDVWVKLLQAPNIFTTDSLKVMKRFKDMKGQATCKQLADKYGNTSAFYSMTCTNLAQRIKKATDCPLYKGGTEENSKWWTVLFVGKYSEDKKEGTYIWKLRYSFLDALEKVNLLDIPLYEPKGSTVKVETSDSTAEAEPAETDKYTKTEFLSEVFISAEKYESIVSVLKNKKNIILQGAPGVGKTFAAKRLAYSVMGVKDESRVKMIQFHQNYSYEDFIMGYKPSGNGYELKNGIFYQFCITAANQPNKDFFFIIDEINRGNMSKIFGELLMMIENDHRGEKTTLAYDIDGVPFYVPQNVYIIGMMNTADRSIAMIDYALRRRFSFIEMEPCFDSEGFTEYQQKLNNPVFDSLIDKIKQLNKEIANDKTLGKGFCIGHSYFCNWQECTISKMREVVEYDIIPTLNEYWFDDAEKCCRWTNELHGVLNDAQ